MGYYHFKMRKAVNKYHILISICSLCLVSSLPAMGRGTVFNMSKEDTVRLNDKQRRGILLLKAQTIREAPPVLEVPIIKIDNQNKIPLIIGVDMIRDAQNSIHKPQKVIKIGNFSIFPPDQVGVHTLRTSEAFDQIAVSSAEIEDDKMEVTLVFEMAPVSKGKSLENVEVVIAPVRWKTE